MLSHTSATFAEPARPESPDRPQPPDAPRKEAGPLKEKMRAARQELQEAIHAEKIDEQVIRDKAADVGKIEGNLAVIRAKAFAKIRPSLTPEQLARMKRFAPGFDRPRVRSFPTEFREPPSSR